jgi:ABC-type histidine transport system ATPase subunit
MAKEFRKPDFSNAEIELRYENGIVCIYGTAKGLKKIADFCIELVGNPSEGHIHLEDYQILTKASEKGAIAIF